MNITSFKVSQDKASLELVLDTASAATTLYLWTNKTYKTNGLEIDLSAKLDGTPSQNISITLADLALEYFDGIYFIEVSDGTNTDGDVTAELTRYKECILEKVLALKDCDNCLEIINPGIYNAQTLLYTLEKALEEKLPQEILHIVYGLDKFCTNSCNNCGQYKNI